MKHLTVVIGVFLILLLLLGAGCSGDNATVPGQDPLEISPASVSLDPGVTMTFSATIFGHPARNVSWSVSAGGGVITPQGVYTAPLTDGIYYVTANCIGFPSQTISSGDNPSQTAIATVYVGNTDVTVGVQ